MNPTDPTPEEMREIAPCQCCDDPVGNPGIASLCVAYDNEGDDITEPCDCPGCVDGESDDWPPGVDGALDRHALYRAKLKWQREAWSEGFSAANDAFDRGREYARNPYGVDGG